MGIEHKHNYRFVFLRSEKWKNVRYEALARENAKCQICGEENFSNDAHHVFYPESVWETESEDLVILCRCCHEFVHNLFGQQKTRKSGLRSFGEILKCVKKWISSKRELLNQNRREILSKSTPSKIVLNPDVDICCRCQSVGNSEKHDLISIITRGKINEACVFRLCKNCKSYFDSVEIKLDQNRVKIRNSAFKQIRLFLKEKP